MKYPAILLIAISFSFVSFVAHAASGASFRNACTKKESWEFSKTIPADVVKKYRQFLKGELTPVQGFAQALALRQYSGSDESKLFGEFWIARSLFETRLIHTALSAFALILNQGIRLETSAITLAALDCTLRIIEGSPSLNSFVAISPNLNDLRDATTPETLSVFHEYLAYKIRNEISYSNFKAEKVEPLLPMLAGSGPFETLSRGLVASRTGKHVNAVANLEKFLASPAIPSALVRFQDHAHLLSARADYALRKFPEAAEHLRQVKKSSNDLVMALSELAWAQLLNYKYGESIGTALSLQTGSLRRTFAPESPMVMAMAMNELCQFPDSIRAIRTFQKHYEASHRWLNEWNTSNRSLYPLAVGFLRKTEKQIPDKVASEWIRSPVFISHQSEINLMIEETESLPLVARGTSDLQFKLSNEILTQIRELKPRFKLAKMKQKVDEPLAKPIIDELNLLKTRIVDLRRLQRAAPIWKKIAESQSPKFRIRKEYLLSAINKDLAQRSQRMMFQLEEIVENIQLIEVEIYNGASHDIIWQNAHPEYKKLAASLNQESTPNAAKTWNWGHSLVNSDEGGEIWEDELGSFEVNLVDNCSSKDKFLALKKRGGL